MIWLGGSLSGIALADALPPALTSGPVLVTAFALMAIAIFAATIFLIFIFARRNRIR